MYRNREKEREREREGGGGEGDNESGGEKEAIKGENVKGNGCINGRGKGIRVREEGTEKGR